MNSLKNKKIAILATDGFEQSELFSPKQAMEDAGATVEVIAIENGQIKGWSENDWGKAIKVDRALGTVSADDYDGLILPGGVINPDKLRNNDNAIEFIQGFFKENKQKPVGAICHGPQSLINAGVVKGRKMTSFNSIKQDLINAEANWVDQKVVCDNGLVTSRTPEDLDAFNSKLIEEFNEGSHELSSSHLNS